MRFAFISTMHDWQWGGSEELWSQAAIKLKQAGHDVHASVAYWPHLSDKVTALGQHGIKLELHGSQNAAQIRRLWNKLSANTRRAYGRLKRFNPDLVVLSQGHNSGGFQWAAICREAAIPYVIIVQCNYEHWWFLEQAGESAAS